MLAIILIALVLQEKIQWSVQQDLKSNIIKDTGLENVNDDKTYWPNRRYRRETGNTLQLESVSTECVKLDACLDDLKTVITGTDMQLFGTSCIPIVNQLMCMHNVIDTSAICLDLRFYFQPSYKLDIMSIQLKLFCRKYEAVANCTEMNQCTQHIKFPLRTPYLAEPQYWCALLKTAIACVEAYKSTCDNSGLDLTNMKFTVDTLCPNAVDVSVVVYEGSGSTTKMTSIGLLVLSISLSLL